MSSISSSCFMGMKMATVEQLRNYRDSLTAYAKLMNVSIQAAFDTCVTPDWVWSECNAASDAAGPPLPLSEREDVLSSLLKDTPAREAAGRAKYEEIRAAVCGKAGATSSTLVVWTEQFAAVDVDVSTLGLSRLEIACVGARRPIAEVFAQSTQPEVVREVVRSDLKSQLQEMESYASNNSGIDQDITLWIPYVRAAVTGEVRDNELAMLPADGRADRLRNECAQDRLSKLYMRRRPDGGIERPCGRSYFGGDVLWTTKHPDSVFNVEVSMTDRVDNGLPVWRVDATAPGASKSSDTRYFAVETKTQAMCRYGCEFVGRHAYIRCDGTVYDVLDLPDLSS